MSALGKHSPMLGLYRATTQFAMPLAGYLLRRRVNSGKEDPTRLHERLGSPRLPRPPGPLIWAHAASVGESVSILALIRAALDERPDAHVVVTTGTVTSAKLMAERLPPRAFHQFVPIDLASAVKGFLDHWRPDLVLWVESEFWPNLILETAARGVPMALISARMSAASQRNWARAPKAAAALLDSFALILPQDADAAARLAALGAPRLGPISNLKLWAEPLPYDALKLAAMVELTQGRPLWLAASTHAGEEAFAAQTHQALASGAPRLLTIIVPRHPKRGPEIAGQLRAMGLKVAQRSVGEHLTPDTDVYLGDTMGEMGLFYRLARLVWIGKSLMGQGGQNPLEPARLACAILSGPHIANFEPVFDLLVRGKAAQILPNAAQIQTAIMRLLQDPDEVHAMGQRAAAIAGDPTPLAVTLAQLRPLFKGMAYDARA